MFSGRFVATLVVVGICGMLAVLLPTSFVGIPVGVAGGVAFSLGRLQGRSE